MAKPTYGCQVTIQSEQEKQMMKMHRREEKRERKRGKGADEWDPSDAGLIFDPREMRLQRCGSFLRLPSQTLSLSSLFCFSLSPLISSCPLSELWLLQQQQSDEALNFKPARLYSKLKTRSGRDNDKATHTLSFRREQFLNERFYFFQVFMFPRKHLSPLR